MCALSVKGLSAGLSNKELRKAFCTANAIAFSNATHNNSKFKAQNHIQITFKLWLQKKRNPPSKAEENRGVEQFQAIVALMRAPLNSAM